MTEIERINFKIGYAVVLQKNDEYYFEIKTYDHEINVKTTVPYLDELMCRNHLFESVVSILHFRINTMQVQEYLN